MTYIYSFGCFKTGTTLVKGMFKSKGLGNYQHYWLKEWVEDPDKKSRHPGDNPEGLYTEAKNLGGEPVYFFRTKRHPVDVIDAVFALPHHFKYFHDGNYLDSLIDYYRRDAEGYANNVRLLEGMKNANCIEADFYDFGEEEKRLALFELMDTVDDASKKRWNLYMRSRWNKEPSRNGKLRQGRQGTLIMEPRMVDYVLAELDDIIELQGPMRSRYV
jgi:hypothetical protein